MIGAEAVMESGVMTNGGEGRIFDEFRRALQSGDGRVALSREVRHFLLAARRKIEAGLERKSQAFQGVDFSPFLKRLLSEIEDGEVL